MNIIFCKLTTGSKGSVFLGIEMKFFEKKIWTHPLIWNFHHSNARKQPLLKFPMAKFILKDIKLQYLNSCVVLFEVRL